MTASYAVSVRQASALPAASFRFHLTMDTLAVRLTVPPVGPVEDFHLQVSAPCRAHNEKGGVTPPFFISCGFDLVYLFSKASFWPSRNAFIPVRPLSAPLLTIVLGALVSLSKPLARRAALLASHAGFNAFQTILHLRPPSTKVSKQRYSPSRFLLALQT